MDKSTFARYVSPAVLGMVGLSCYILVDTLYGTHGVWLSFIVTEAVVCVFSLLSIRDADKRLKL